MESNRGDWFVTASGRRLYVRDPDPSQIVIEDIASHLAKLCRFGGAVPGDNIYSVAQHSLLVLDIFQSTSEAWIPPSLLRGALLHDAAEAYIQDLIRPVKREVGAAYREIEDLWEAAIMAKFSARTHDAIKVADLRALATERRDLLPFADPNVNPGAWKWKEDELAVEPWPERIVPMTVREARVAFLSRFEELL